MAEKPERKVSPIGEAKWAHVHRPKAPFEGTGDPKYMIDVIFEKGGEWDPLCKKIMEVSRAKGYANKPIKPEKDDMDQPTGRFFITFKTAAQFPPRVFDRFGTVIPPEVLVGNGSKVRVAYRENEYKGLGGGFNFYLNAVQVIELVEYSGGNATDYGFETEKGTAEPDWNGDSQGALGEPWPEPDGLGEGLPPDGDSIPF